MADFEDYYEILQVSFSAEPEVIEGAFNKLAKKYHPDVNRSPSATERMKKINMAHDILSNPDKRREYDKEWQKHKVGGASQEGTSQSKTSHNNTHPRRPNDYKGKPQPRVLVIALLIADIVLLVIFLLVPWIRQALAHYPWLKVTLLLLVLIFAGSAIGVRGFRRVLTDSIKSFFSATRSWVTGGDPDKAQRDRILTISLSIIFVALLVLFILIPWIRIIIARYTWLKVLFWVLLAIFIFGLFKSKLTQPTANDKDLDDGKLCEILRKFKPRRANEHVNNYHLCEHLRENELDAKEKVRLINDQIADIVVDNNAIIEGKPALVSRVISQRLKGQLIEYRSIVGANGQPLYDIYAVIYGDAKSDFVKQLERETHSHVVILGKML